MKRGYYAKEVKLAVMLSCRKENWVFLYRLSTTVCVSVTCTLLSRFFSHVFLCACQ